MVRIATLSRKIKELKIRKVKFIHFLAKGYSSFLGRREPRVTADDGGTGRGGASTGAWMQLWRARLRRAGGAAADGGDRARRRRREETERIEKEPDGFKNLIFGGCVSSRQK
jgi:hypothetical protein